MIIVPRSLTVLFAAILAGIVSVASAQFEGMVSRVPLDANTLIMIDAQKLFGSPLADRERWEARRTAAFNAGVSALPPDASSVVMAAHTDFDSSRNRWELALVRFDQGRDVNSVATRFGGAMDTISDRTAARLPSDHYVVQISPQMLGTYAPANRQSVARWLASTDKSDLDNSLSPYLIKAVGYATKVGTPIVMAIDVRGVFSPAEARNRLDDFEALQSVAGGAESIARLAGGVQGATLGITVGDKAAGAIRVDFDEPIELPASVLKPVLLEVLARHGAMVDDFETWAPSLDGGTFKLSGTLSTAGTRRVLSVLELPPSLAHSLEESSPSGSSAAHASQLYFQSVRTLLDDLRAKPKKDGVQTMGQAAIWYDKYARKIDDLPVLGVDPVLLSFGADIANGLREANSALRGVGMRTAVRTTNYGASSSGPVAPSGGVSPYG
ncbi:MAG: hypothetical protein ACO1RT_11265 [Planctomycetaceae bacterium]